VSNDKGAIHRQKFAFLEAVARHPDLSATAKGVAIMIAVRYADRHGKAWPSQKRLGDDVGRSDRQVRTAIAELVEAKLLTSTVKRGPKGDVSQCFYAMVVPEAHFRNNSGSALPLFDDNSGSPAHEFRKSTSENSGSALPPNPIREPGYEPNGVCAPPLRDLIAVWGGGYSVPLGAAFEAALQLAPAETILEGARSWVTLPRPSYPRDLTTWLNERRWKEHPSEARGDQPRPKQHAPRRSRMHTRLAAMARRRGEQFGGSDDTH